MDQKSKPVFEKRIFRDVNFEQIDYDAKANFVIERVFSRGDVEDIRQCRRFYGDEKVTATLLHTKYLPEHRIHLASAVIDKPLNEFRSYTLRQLNPRSPSFVTACPEHREGVSCKSFVTTMLFNIIKIFQRYTYRYYRVQYQFERTIKN
jgi:hypothetical protein